MNDNFNLLHPLNVKTAVKRACYLADTDIIRKKVGSLEPCDIKRIESALKIWLDLE